MKLFSELKRRNVLRMVVLYVVAAWLTMQVAEVIIDLANLPEWIGPTVLALLAIGFPIALILSWFYEITPQGISLDKDVDRGESIPRFGGRRMDFIVISVLTAALILFAYDKWWTGGPPEKSIAVLAFENMSGDPEQEYFSDGISEELLNLLAQIPELKVISRSSAFSFKNKDVAIPVVAAQLNVAHVLEGSVRKMGNRVRITAQLIDASSDSHLWSESYDRELDDIFAVQDEIAGAIGNALKVKLAIVAGEAVQPAVIKAANTAAYDAYLQGREMFRRRRADNVRDAIRYFEQSLRLDNNFAPAHAQLAIATTMLGHYGESSLAEVRRIAIRHLDRAQVLEPDLAEAHLGRGFLAGLEGDLESEMAHYLKALELNPISGDALNWLHIAYSRLGRYEEADAIMQRMLVADPLNYVIRWNYGEWLARQGRTEEAHELADQILVQSPRWGYWLHAETSLFYEGKLAEGLSWALRRQAHSLAMHVFIWIGEFDEARRIDGSDSYWVDHVQGRFEESIRATQEELQLAPDNEGNLTLAAGVLYEAGRIEEALPLFERALEFVPEGRPFSEPLPLHKTMWLAQARRHAGDEYGAQAAAQIVRQDLAARRATGRNNADLSAVEALIAAFDNNPDGVITALKSAIELGLRNPHHAFYDRIFNELRDEPRFVALKKELDAILSEERDKILQLICFNNPVPHDWQPLPDTCEGVMEQSKL
jgi:TolB-like protein/Tfp pilus assembly protein PilF